VFSLVLCSFFNFDKEGVKGCGKELRGRFGEGVGVARNGKV
jgi:hypothetical protein